MVRTLCTGNSTGTQTTVMSLLTTSAPGKCKKVAGQEEGGVRRSLPTVSQLKCVGWAVIGRKDVM